MNRRFDTTSEVIETQETANAFLHDINAFPIDFDYGGQNAREFLKQHPLRIETTETADRKESVCSADDGAFRIRFRLIQYKDFPVLEWHTDIENTASVRSARLSRVRTARIEIPLPDPNKMILRRRHGSFNAPRFGTGGDQFNGSFLPEETPLENNAGPILFDSGDGRPSVDWLPIADFASDETVTRLAIGWGGQWTAEVQTHDGRVEVTMGVKDLDAVMEPGETFELPSIFLVRSASGGDERVSNLWRRFVTSHLMTPTADGKTPEAPIAFTHWGGMGESEQMSRIADIRKHNMPMEVYWIDAGWYAPRNADCFSPEWAEYTGDWEFNSEAYPDELKNVSREVHEAGKKLLLWLEPERVRCGRKIAEKYPDYFIGLPGGDTLLLNIGRPDAWQWCYDTVSSILERNNIDWYREDFNLNPLPYWRTMDTPDRRGVTEMHCVAGVRKFWKALRKKFPNLMIDNCSSGGRRMDLELLRLSLPLWYSDMYCFPDWNPEASLSHIRGFSAFWPRFSGGQKESLEADTYSLRAIMTQGIVVAYFVTAKYPVSDAYPRDWLKQNIACLQTIRPFLAKDFYCLAEPTADNVMWTIFQYDSPEDDAGAVMLFRSEKSPVQEITLRPRALNPDTLYEISDLDGVFEPVLLRGDELMTKGFPIRIDKARTARILCYRNQNVK